MPYRLDFTARHPESLEYTMRLALSLEYTIGHTSLSVCTSAMWDRSVIEMSFRYLSKNRFRIKYRTYVRYHLSPAYHPAAVNHPGDKKGKTLFFYHPGWYAAESSSNESSEKHSDRNRFSPPYT